MAEKNEQDKKKSTDLGYLKFLEEKKNWTEEEKFVFETLSLQNKQALPDLDYLEYLRTKNEWSDRDELLWGYLSAIACLLYRLVGGTSEEETSEGRQKPNLMGQYRIYHPPEKGIRKGPPPTIL